MRTFCPSPRYVLDATGAPWVSTADPAEVSLVIDRLEKFNSVLVVISDDPAPAFPVVVEHRPPDPKAVLLSHLAHGQGVDTVKAAKAVLDRALRYEHVRVTYERLRQPWNAVAVARALVAWWHQLPRDPDAVPDVEAFQHAEALRRARIMLRGSSELEATPRAQSFIVGGAVLDGVAVSRVIDASHRLALLFEQVNDSARTSDRSLFAEPLRRWLHHVELTGSEKESTQSLRSDAGNEAGLSSKVKVVRMSEPMMAGVLLEVIWNEYDRARRPVLQWLVELCASRDETVRVLAALAVGKLAALDFEIIDERIFRSWSQDKNYGQVLAWALESVVVDGRLSRRVLDLLQTWATGSDFQQRATAIRAYGTSIGARNPKDAIKGIDSAYRGQIPMERITVRSLVEIYISGHREDVLGKLDDWAGRGGRYRTRAASCLMLLADLNSPYAKKIARPDLLSVLSKSEELRRPMVRLWAAGLADSAVHGDAWTLLGIWRAIGSGEEGSRHSAARFAADVLEEAGARPEIRTRLNFYERLWESKKVSRLAQVARI